MARLKLYDNIFEENSREVVIDLNRPLIEQIEELSENSYASDMVECYDTETGETYYAPFVEDDEQSVIITANGHSVSSDYKVQPEDYIEVVYLPLGSRDGSVAVGVVIGALVGLALGGVIGYGVGVTSGAMFSTFAATNAALWGGAAGALIGGVAGGLIGGSIWDKEHPFSNYKEGKTQPDVRGSSNQTLTNNCYPYVLGKHLITPFIVGAPYTEYSGENGETAYIRELLCAGYGPLKLTDFKLGETYLAYNRTQGVERNTILKGLLKGYKDDDAGDILNVWKNNEVEIEIIQQPQGGNWRGSIYPETVKDTEVNTPALFVCDKNLQDIAEITYKGTSFPSNFKTNTVQFTERCTKKFRVTLDFPNGLYSSYTNSSNEVKYDRIPVWMAVQWRVKNVNNKSSDPNGSDYDLWNNITTFNGHDLSQVFDSTAYAADKAAHKGNDFSNLDVNTINKNYIDMTNPMNLINEIVNEKYDSSESNKGRKSGIKIPSGYGNWSVDGLEISDLGIISTPMGSMTMASQFYYVGTLLDETSDPYTKSAVIYDSRYKALIVGIYTEELDENLTVESGEKFVSYELSTTQNISLYNYKNALNINGRDDAKTTTVEVKTIVVPGNTYKRKVVQTEGYAGSWLGKTLVNFDKDGLWTGKDHISQMRATAEVELTEDQIKEMMDSQKCPTNSVEVRVLRVSPSYLNQQTGDSSSSPRSYSDVTKWLSLTSFTFDEDAYQKDGTIQPLYAVADEDLDKFCFIAVKAKADSAGYINGSIDKLNCIAEAFAPYWNESSHQWVPSNVSKKTKYYGYWTDNTKTEKCDRANDAYESEVIKSEFETARGQGYNWYKKDCGSDYFDTIRDTVLNPNLYSYDGKQYWDSKHEYEADIKTDITIENGTYKHNEVDCILLSTIAAAHNNNSVASGFMLSCVGPQNGTVAIGYDEINLLSVSELAEYGESVTDGSRYSRDTWVGGKKYAKDDIVTFRFEANAYIYQQSKLEDVLSNIAVCGRSIFTYDEKGRIKIITDKPVPYCKGIISQQNCISGSNTFDFTDNFAGYQLQYPDEDNGYENGLMYCWGDGNSIKNYKGQVVSLSLAYVTNSNQAWSLGRYALACASLQKTTLTRKIGREGSTFGIGDVVEVQSEELLIGNDSGRIQQILSSGTQVFGFVTDATYEYTGETVNGESKQGVTILQPQRFGNDRIKTVRLAVNNTSVVINLETYTLKKGVTNVVLFEEPVNFSNSGFYFNVGDTVLFGEYGKISEKYRVVKVKPESDGSFTQTLIPYLEELYNYGDKLPVFHPAITEPQVIKDAISLSEVPINLEEQNNLQKQTIDNVTKSIPSVYSNHIATLYKRSTTEITEHGITDTLVYNFSDNTLTWQDVGEHNGWVSEISEATGEGDLYAVSATAFGQGITYDILSSYWSEPMPYGKNGANGINVYTIQLFQRQIEMPGFLPEGVKYNFKTTELTATNFHKWSQSYPEVDEEGNPVWETHATASSNTDIDDSIVNWSTPVIISKDVQVTKADVENIINEMGIAPTPVVDCSVTFMGIQTNADGFVTIDQSITADVSVRQGTEKLDFTFGEITLPSSYWETDIVGNKITIRVKRGARVIGGSISIPVEFNAYSELFMYGYSTTEGYQDNTDTPYGVKILAEGGTRYNISLGYTMIKGGAYKSVAASVSDIPSSPVIGDYFTWTGVNTESDLCSTGVFKQTGIYQYNGINWDPDSNTEHMAGALSDVLSTADAIIESGNPMVDQLLGRLTANETFTKKLVVTDGAFIRALATSSIVIGENDSDSGFIESYGFIRNRQGWRIEKNKAEFNEVTVRGTITATAFNLTSQAIDDMSNILDSYSFATIDQIINEDVLHYRSTQKKTPAAPTSKVTTTAATTDNVWSLGTYGPKTGCYYYKCVQRVSKNKESKAEEVTWGTVSEDTDPENIKLLSERTTVTETQISDITADNKLTPNEKQDLLEEWNSILEERSILEQKGVSFTAYEAAFSALAKVLNGGTAWVSGTPALLANLTTTSTVNGSDLRSKFVTYNTEKTKLSDNISKKYADTVQDNLEKDIEKYSRVTVVPASSEVFFKTDKTGKAVGTQIYRILLSAYVGEVEIDFKIRDDKYSNSKVSLSHDGKYVVLTVKNGTVIENGSINIPVSTIAQTITSDPYGYVDKNNKEYVNEVYLNGTDIYYATINYQAQYGDRYRNAVDSVTWIQPPCLVDDFFTWTGVNTSTIINGVSVDLIKGCVYRWNGFGWERDRTTGHFVEALSDVLDVNNDLLKQNNSDVESFFKKVVTKQLFTDQLVANDAFINKLAASEAFINDLGAQNIVINSNGYICSQDWLDNKTGFYFGAEGSLIANDALIRGSIYSENGSIGGILINDNGLESSGFSSDASKGFQIKKDGTALFNSLTAKTLYIGQDAVDKFINDEVTKDINNKNKGAWNSATTYSKGDIVTYSGSTYSALKATTNNNPSTSTGFWTVYASKGDQGKYMKHLYYIGDFGLTAEQLRTKTWSETQGTVGSGQCLYEATKWSE